MILSARDLKLRGVLCALRFVPLVLVDFSMSHGGRGECGMPTLSVSACCCIPQCVRLIAGDWCLHVVD